MGRRFVVTSALVLAALLVAADAYACVCANVPLRERLDDADAAVVGRIVDRRETVLRGAPQTIFTVEVEQRVKGDVGRELSVASPRGSDCDLVPPTSTDESGAATGLLLARGPDGRWLASACSVVDAGLLVAEGGEPRGGPTKVAIGIVLLGLVLLWSVRRLRRGARPDLPGAPRT